MRVIAIVLSLFGVTIAHADLGLQAQLYQKHGGKVVRVLNPRNHESGGTGFHVRTPLNRVYILTNAHVCEVGVNKQMHTLLDIGTQVSVTKVLRIIKEDKKHDLCLLSKAFDTDGIPLARQPAHITEVVTGLGHPYLLPLAPFQGLMLEYVDDNEIYTSAVAYPGNSGSPVLNERGELIGVLNAIFVQTNAALYIPLQAVKNFLRGF